METYHGHVRTPTDAIILFEACRLGTLPRVQRRLSEKERQSIKSGSIFVWDEREAGMRRWTDGKSWSASRVSGSFLTYREMEGKRGASNYQAGVNRAGRTPESNKGSDSDMEGAGEEGPDGYRYKPDGLMKQSFSITTSTNQHLHLISYYSRQSGVSLQPSQDPALRHIRPPKGMYPEASLADQSQTPLVTRTPMASAPMTNGHLPPYPGAHGPPMFRIPPGMPYPGQPFVAFPPNAAPMPGQHFSPPHLAYPQPIHGAPHPALGSFQDPRTHTPPVLPPATGHMRTSSMGSGPAPQGPLSRPFPSNQSESSILSGPAPYFSSSTPHFRGTILPGIMDLQMKRDELQASGGTRTRTPSPPPRHNSSSTPTSRDTAFSTISSPTTTTATTTPKPVNGHTTTIPSIGSLVNGVLRHEANSRSASKSPAGHVRVSSMNENSNGIQNPNVPENAPRDIEHSRIKFTGEDMRALRVLDKAFRT